MHVPAGEFRDLATLFFSLANLKQHVIMAGYILKAASQQLTV